MLQCIVSHVSLYTMTLTRSHRYRTEPELLAKVSKAIGVVAPGFVEICLSIHSPLEHLNNNIDKAGIERWMGTTQTRSLWN